MNNGKNRCVLFDGTGGDDRRDLCSVDDRICTDQLWRGTGEDFRGADDSVDLYTGSDTGTVSGVSASNILGGCILPDVIFGSLATLLGAVGTWLLRRQHKCVAALPPILTNILIVPFVLRYGYQVPLPIWLLMGTVGLGEVISCEVLGCILATALEKYKHKIFRTA